MAIETGTLTADGQSASSGQLVRAIDWKGAFWVASGVPALVLFSIGGIAGTAGKLAFVVWTVSMIMGFLQSFTYAEIAGLFPNKSGGASIYGATAWLRYSKLIAPLSVWCNWFAWSPVLSLGCAIAAGYILNAVAPIPVFTDKSPEVVSWLADPTHAGKVAADAITAVTTLHTPAIQAFNAYSVAIPGLGTLNFNSSFFIGALLMLIVFAIQHRGILGTASAQKYIGLLVIIPMLIVGIVPLFNGGFHAANVAGPYLPGVGDNVGWTMFLGAMFIAAWSTYGFETAVCYTSEFRNPKTDTFKAIFYSGLLCLLLYILVPFTFQGVLGVDGMKDPGIVAGTGVADAMANMVAGGNLIIKEIFVGLMILALVLAIMTAMAGSSRTLYQGSVDGWLPRYLSYTNSHGAPTRAMWTDLVFNLFLLAIASDSAGYFFILAVSNVGYIIFNFLNLNAGWMHRVDSGHIERPYRAPSWLIGLNTILAFVNALFMGAGAKVWGYSNALWVGFGFAALIIPVFAFRHYVQDKGHFPAGALEDIGLTGQDLGVRKAGVLPYLALLLGLVIVLVSNWFFQLPA
ncbi:APC family permease [Hyphomicrobium sp.]|jgi:amino acid transporter|uniref:APC family permease n=1 Tax=Hyphomicrobium sp. TaxID=82 RepID=UPI00356AD47A